MKLTTTLLYFIPAACKRHSMKKQLQMNFLLGVAVALFILDETQVSCGVIVGKVTSMNYLELKKQMHFLHSIKSVNISIPITLKFLVSICTDKVKF
jgi:hypothetical protein